MKSKPKIFNPADPVEVKFVATIYNILTKGFDMTSIYRCGNCDNIDVETVIIYFMLQQLTDLKFAVIVEQKLIGAEVIQ
jgi:hypothetical protein